MYTVYVLKSLKNGKRYVGFTSKSIKERFDWHKWGLSAWTRQQRPLVILYSEQHGTKEEAMKRERYFKTGQGRRTLDHLVSSVSAKNHGGRATQFGAG